MEDTFNTYDVKLTNGKYLSNVVISDWSGACYSIQEILNNYYYNNGIREDLLMSAWDEFDDDCVNELATFYSTDIEYIAESYKNYN